jgi:hypothetical protein
VSAAKKSSAIETVLGSGSGKAAVQLNPLQREHHCALKHAPTRRSNRLWRRFTFTTREAKWPFPQSDGTAFTAVSSLAALPTGGRVLIVGPDALSASDSTSTALAAWAANGRSVIVSIRSNPLRYQASDRGNQHCFRHCHRRAAHQRTGRLSRRFEPSIMRNLRGNDFRGWGNDGEVYRNAYLKPARGARSLVQVGPRLEQSALIEIPTGKRFDDLVAA